MKLLPKKPTVPIVVNWLTLGLFIFGTCCECSYSAGSIDNEVHQKEPCSRYLCSIFGTNQSFLFSDGS